MFYFDVGVTMWILMKYHFTLLCADVLYEKWVLYFCLVLYHPSASISIAAFLTFKMTFVFFNIFFVSIAFVFFVAVVS